MQSKLSSDVLVITLPNANSEYLASIVIGIGEFGLFVVAVTPCNLNFEPNRNVTLVPNNQVWVVK